MSRGRVWRSVVVSALAGAGIACAESHSTVPWNDANSDTDSVPDGAPPPHPGRTPAEACPDDRCGFARDAKSVDEEERGPLPTFDASQKLDDGAAYADSTDTNDASQDAARLDDARAAPLPIQDANDAPPSCRPSDCSNAGADCPPPGSCPPDCEGPCSLPHAKGSCLQGVCSLVSCESGFLDCDGLNANGCEAPTGEAPAVPALRAPTNGAYTGSALAKGSPAHAPRPRTPQFRWEASTGGRCNRRVYQIQIDDRCSGAQYKSQACPFTSPRIDVSGLHTTSYTPPLPLDAQGAAAEGPVGRRYYWRVRACDEQGCNTPWSVTRYLNVGQLPDDMDGDGNSDVAVPEGSGSLAPHVSVFLGGRPPSNVAHRLPVGHAVRAAFDGQRHAWAGDVNADGFADLVVGGAAQGVVTVLFGGSRASLAGGGAPLHLRLPLPDPPPPAREAGAPDGESLWGTLVASAGDMNADGYDDLLAGHTRTDGTAYVYLLPGGPAQEMAKAQPILIFSGKTLLLAVKGAGDLDEGGKADALVATADRAYLFQGETQKAIPSVLAPETSGRVLGPATRAGDFNMDGFDDLALLVDRCPRPTCMSRQRTMAVVFGGPEFAQLKTTDLYTFDLSTAREASDLTGGGDMDDDGVPDLVLGQESLALVAVVRGSAAFPAGLPLTSLRTYALGTDLAPDRSGFGCSLGLGDYDGDGLADTAIGALGGSKEGADASPKAADLLLVRGRSDLYAGSAWTTSPLTDSDVPSISHY